MINLLIITIFLLLFYYNLKSNTDFFTTQGVQECDSVDEPNTSNFSCGTDNCCLNNKVNNCVSNSDDSKYDKVINPDTEYCVDFCVDTYTDENSGEFISSKLVNYFTSKCGQCIKNNYNRLSLIKTSDD
jgi:hypothetical protein